MTSTAVATLPTTSDPSAWSGEEKALVEAAGLVHVDARSGERTAAPRPVVAAFLGHCARTGLDPIARQIYCLARKSKGQLKWQIQVSIDGARLVAERSGQYEGQTPVEWTADGVTWTQVWLSPEHPAAARVGVYRRGFREALFAVATWDSYAVYDDVWRNGEKTGESKVSAMWGKMGPLMLGKCAEMLALRKAFPQDLSGLYSTEEMAQAGPPAAVAAVTESAPEPAAHVEPTKNLAYDDAFAKVNWAARIVDATSVDELRQVHADASKAGELGMFIDPKFQTHIDGMLSLFGLPKPDGYVLVGDAIRVVKPVLERLAAEDVVDAEVVEDEPAQIDERDPSAGMSWPTVEPGSGGRTADPDSGVEFR